jgi:osmotically-inducible protein OsmY
MLPSYMEDVPISRYLDYWHRFTYSAAASDPPTATVSDQYRTLATERERARQAHTANPQGPRPDVDIAAEVRQELRDEGQIEAHKIKVEVFGTVAVLEGEQNDLAARQAAEQAAFRVPDVRDVVNMLVVNASI